jgi:hypothetical protein
MSTALFFHPALSNAHTPWRHVDDAACEATPHMQAAPHSPLPAELKLETLRCHITAQSFQAQRDVVTLKAHVLEETQKIRNQLLLRLIQHELLSEYEMLEAWR